MTEPSGKRQLYERLFVAREDLFNAKQYSLYLLKKGWHRAPYECRGTTYMQQSAFTTAAVICYARPFTNSKGWPAFDFRICEYDEAQALVHKSLIERRNQVYAHTDSAKHSVRPFQIDQELTSDLLNIPFVRLSKPECESIVQMVDQTISKLAPRLQALKLQIIASDEA